MATEIRALAEFVAKLCPENISDDLLCCACSRVLDNVPAALAASGDPLVSGIINTYRDSFGRDGTASLWGRPEKCAPVTAAFINSLMCHTLELDDVHAQSKSHIGTVVIPAAWAMAEHLGTDGRSMLLAVIAGYEVEARIAMSFGVKEHRKLGWHVTATAGVFGAAAACGKLLGLDTDAMVSCLGLAGAQSMGNWAFLSGECNCKALNPARACAVGMEAALLAKAGMLGPENILTAEDGGLYSLMTSRAYPDKLCEGLGERWEIRNVDSKPYPCCRSTHCAIDAALALRQEHDIQPGDIMEIRIDTYLIGKQQCAEAASSLDPHTPVDAKFSLPYCVAAAFMAGAVSMSEFHPDHIKTVRESGLMKKITVHDDKVFTDAYPLHWGCRIILRCTDGCQYEKLVLDASGSVYAPLSPAQADARALLLVEKSFPNNSSDLIELLKLLPFASVLPRLYFA